MNQLFFIIIMAILTSCNFEHDKVSMIQSKGLNKENLRLNSLLFCNRDTGYIAGSSDIVVNNTNENSNVFASVNRKALLFKTVDGGKSWKEAEFGEGSFQNIFQAGNKIFAIKVSEETHRRFIYSSDNWGQSWQEEKNISGQVSNLFFIDELYLAITSDSSFVRSYMSLSRNKGKSWETSSSDLPIFDAIVQDNKLFYLSSNIDSYEKNLLVCYKLKDKVRKIIELPHEFNCYFLTNYNSEIKLIGRKGGQIAVYTLQNDKIKYQYSYISNNDYFPQGYYNCKNNEYVIVGKRNKAEVSNQILKTSDNGSSWDIINFNKDNYIKPFCFINENNKVSAWFYSGNGKFQKLN